MSRRIDRHIRPLVAALVLPVALPALAAAPAQKVEEMVVTATRLPTAASRLPTPVSVIDRADIRTNAWLTLPDALRRVPGASVVTSGGVGGNTSVFLRGTNSDHVLVLLDGLPANDPSLAAGAFNFGDDLLDGVERIEVVRAPASTLYGASAIGGVVSLVTRAGADGPARSEVDVGIGTDRTRRASAGLYGTRDRVDFGVTVQGLTTDGDDATPRRLSGRNGDEDGVENLTATAKGILRLDRGRLEAVARWRRAAFDIDNVPADDPNSTGTAEQFAWQLSGETGLWDDRLVSRLAIGQTLYDRGFDNAPDTADPTLVDDRFDGSRTLVDWQNTLSLPAAAGSGIRDAAFVFGATWIREGVDLETRSVSAFGPFTQAVDAEADGIAVFLHGQVGLGERVDLTAGVRHDRPDDYGDRTTWRLGAAIQVPELAARLFGSVGSAFKAPSLFDRYGINNFGYSGNPDLRPETSVGWEAGVEADLGAHATLTATWFGNDVDDLIRYDFASNSSLNVAKAEIEGVETVLTVRPMDWFELSASWTWTDARDGRTGARLLRRPEHALFMATEVRPRPGLTIATEAGFTGRRQDVRYDDAGMFLGAGSVGGVWLVNLAVTQAVSDDVDAYARVGNLLDRRIEDPNGYARPDRGVLAGVRARF